eukprot:g2925.t1
MASLIDYSEEDVEKAQHGLQQLLEMAGRQEGSGGRGSGVESSVVDELMQDDSLLQSLSDLLGDDIVSALNQDYLEDSGTSEEQSAKTPMVEAQESGSHHKGPGRKHHHNPPAKVELPNKFTNYEMYLFRQQKNDPYLPGKKKDGTTSVPKPTAVDQKQQSKEVRRRKQEAWLKHQTERSQKRKLELLKKRSQIMESQMEGCTFDVKKHLYTKQYRSNQEASNLKIWERSNKRRDERIKEEEMRKKKMQQMKEGRFQPALCAKSVLMVERRRGRLGQARKKEKTPVKRVLLKKGFLPEEENVTSCLGHTWEVKDMELNALADLDQKMEKKLADQTEKAKIRSMDESVNDLYESAQKSRTHIKSLRKAIKMEERDMCPFRPMLCPKSKRMQIHRKKRKDVEKKEYTFQPKTSKKHKEKRDRLVEKHYQRKRAQVQAERESKARHRGDSIEDLRERKYREERADRLIRKLENTFSPMVKVASPIKAREENPEINPENVIPVTEVVYNADQHQFILDTFGVSWKEAA